MHANGHRERVDLRESQLVILHESHEQPSPGLWHDALGTKVQESLTNLNQNIPSAVQQFIICCYRRCVGCLECHHSGTRCATFCFNSLCSI